MPGNKAAIRSLQAAGFDASDHHGQKAFLKGWGALERLLLARARELESYDNTPDWHKALTIRDELRIIREGFFQTPNPTFSPDGAALYDVDHSTEQRAVRVRSRSSERVPA